MIFHQQVSIFLLNFLQESSVLLALGEAFGIKAPEKKVILLKILLSLLL
jgi:hypothetical protein